LNIFYLHYAILLKYSLFLTIYVLVHSCNKTQDTRSRGES